MSKGTIELNQNNLSESAASLETALTAAGADRRECMNALLLAEELFARMAAEPGMTVHADVQRRWGNITLRLSCEGDQLNPIVASPFPEGDEQDGFRTKLLLTTFLAALLLSVGAPGVAGAAFICLTTIVVSLGLPAEAATFVLGIDSLLSMLRISNNVIGDTAVACAVAASERLLDHAIYQKN